MTWVAVAVAGSAVVGAVASNQASKRQEKGAEKAIKSTKELAAQARNDAISLFQQGQKSGAKGIQAAMDFYKNSANAMYQPYIQGNVAAQDVIGQGAQQANNAILGLPVDMGFTQPRQINPDLSYLQGASLPTNDSMMLGSSEPAQPQNKNSSKQSAKDMFLTGGGWAASPEDTLDPRTALTNPLGTLGFGKKITNKDPGRKLLKKLF